jgi:hypothetical protein
MSKQGLAMFLGRSEHDLLDPVGVCSHLVQLTRFAEDCLNLLKASDFWISYWSVLDVIEICWILFDFVEICLIFLKCAGFSMDFIEF